MMHDTPPPHSHAQRSPRVSVVIPTFERPNLIGAAVASALQQTMPDLETIVVVDGRDAATLRALEQISDARLRVIVPPRQLGNADARNAGVAEARGQWIAFLDDDDRWRPTKLERQLQTADQSTYAEPIVACRLEAQAGHTTLIWPRRYPRPGEALSEYLFCRSTPFSGEGVVQTSAILAPRTLLTAVPFTSGLRHHVDPDWLLRAVQRPGVGVEFVPDPEPLLTWDIQPVRPRVSSHGGWRESLAWARANRELLTPRAYAGFVLSLVSAAAARERCWRALGMLAWDAWRWGDPHAVDALTHVGHFMLPARLQDVLVRMATAQG